MDKNESTPKKDITPTIATLLMLLGVLGATVLASVNILLSLFVGMSIVGMYAGVIAIYRLAQE